jgi:hypothetical protein
MIRSAGFRIEPREAGGLREEVWLNPEDAAAAALPLTPTYGIWAQESLFLGAPTERKAVLIRPDAATPRGVLQANKRFLIHAGIDSADPMPWLLEPTVSPVSLRSVVFETATELASVEHELQRLRRIRKEVLDGRCLLYDSKNERTDLALPMEGLGYFNLQSLSPPPSPSGDATVLVIDGDTELKLFVPHRRAGVDMVVAVDVSGSMWVRDYVGDDNRPKARLEGAREGLLRLFEKRLISGSRVSRFAVLVFAGDSRSLYPKADVADTPEMAEIREVEQLQEMQASTRLLNETGLKMLNVDWDGGTNISGVLRDAADLLDIFAREGNEKLIVLLSDGAHTTRNQRRRGELEVISTIEEPAVMADTLQHDSGVRICSVAISNEENVRRYAPEYAGRPGYVPDVNLLQRIAQATDGLFFDQPDGRALSALLDLLGQGVMYPI